AVIVPGSANEVDLQKETEVKETIRQHLLAYSRKDLKAIMATVAPDAVFIGSGTDERLVGWGQIKAAYERDFGRKGSASFTFTWTSVASRGKVAWFASDCKALLKSGTRTYELVGRWTGVLEKEGDRWLFVQSHFSFPFVPPGNGQPARKSLR
ncbi:MAG: nuclear transport factor 2 family protein, partial [Deltaproteobacteria bacterium]